jgi:hypothetical protein
MPYTLRGLGFEAHWPFDSGLEEKDSILYVKSFRSAAVVTEALSKRYLPGAQSGSIAAASAEWATQWDVPVGLWFPRRAPPLAQGGYRLPGNKFIASNPTRAVADNRGSCSHIAVAVAVTVTNQGLPTRSTG